jgi:hypothetical protein
MDSINALFRSLDMLGLPLGSQVFFHTGCDDAEHSPFARKSLPSSGAPVARSGCFMSSARAKGIHASV